MIHLSGLKSNKALLPVAAVLLLLLMIAWMAGVFSNRVAPGLQPLADTDTSQAVPVEIRTSEVLETVPASVEAKQATLISSRIMARIETVNVRAGDSVNEGQLLIQLEKTDLAARAKQAAENARALAARLEEARQNLTRMSELRKQQLVAVADLDRARANYNALQAELASAQQAREEAETALDFAAIRAPITGRVVDRFAEPGDTAAPGVNLLSLYNPLSLRIEAQVREQLALPLQIDQQVNVAIPSLALKVPGNVEERVPAAEPGSRSFLVKVRIPYQPQLLPGMYARLLLPAGTEMQLLVPAERVAEVGQLNVVWVLENGQRVRRFVRTGKQYDGRLEITAGLTAGDLVLPVNNTD